MPKYCDCEVGNCDGEYVERCAERHFEHIYMVEDADVPFDQVGEIVALKRLRSGEDVVVPKSRHHAECMRMVAKAYVDGLDPFVEGG